MDSLLIFFTIFIIILLGVFIVLALLTALLFMYVQSLNSSCRNSDNDSRTSIYGCSCRNR